jgi:pimeloyl-ACP methyl ester carboxylesterase
MTSVTSADGTRIAYERLGSGPAVILIGGGLDDGSENEPLAEELAAHFTTFNYARRGRGRTGDIQPYAVERELEDISALIEEAGGRAHVYGASSGGMFALEGALAGIPIDSVALYEVPYDTADEASRRHQAYREQLQATLAAGRRGDAVELFMRLAGATDEQVQGARSSPYWSRLEALAHSLAYDAALYGPPPVSRLAALTAPTLVATGGTADFYESAADALATAIPRGERLRLEGQSHVPDPRLMAGTLRRFFTQRRSA